MAKRIVKAAYVSLNAVDRSANFAKAELQIEWESKDATTFGSGGAKEVLLGLLSGSLAVSVKNDVAAGAIDEVLWALGGQVVPFEVRVDNAAVSTSNPRYTGQVAISSLTPLSGGVGDINEASYTWETSGPITRATV